MKVAHLQMRSRIFSELFRKTVAGCRDVFLGKSGDFPGAEEGLLSALLLCPSSGSTVVVFYICVSPELKGATEPSRAEPSQADPITIPSFL